MAQQTHPILFLGRRHTISAPTMAKEIAKIGVRLKNCCVKRILGGRWGKALPPKFVPAPHRAIVATASVHPSQTLTRADKGWAAVVIGYSSGRPRPRCPRPAASPGPSPGRIRRTGARGSGHGAWADRG